MQIGVSSFLWRQQHVVGHHTLTNLDSDPDIRASAQDVRRVAPHHQRHWYHVSALKGFLQLPCDPSRPRCRNLSHWRLACHISEGLSGFLMTV